MEARDCVLGIDVGTRAARAALFTVDGELLASAQHEIALYQPSGCVVVLGIVAMFVADAAC